MIRYMSVRVFDTSGKDLLQASELVDVQLGSSFHDVYADLPGDVAARELKSVKLREFQSASDAHRTILTGTMLFKTILQLNETLQQQRARTAGGVEAGLSGGSQSGGERGTVGKSLLPLPPRRIAGSN